MASIAIAFVYYLIEKSFGVSITSLAIRVMLVVCKAIATAIFDMVEVRCVTVAELRHVLRRDAAGFAQDRDVLFLGKGVEPVAWWR